VINRARAFQRAGVLCGETRTEKGKDKTHNTTVGDHTQFDVGIGLVGRSDLEEMMGVWT
jgi:hypothetical protein